MVNKLKKWRLSLLHTIYHERRFESSVVHVGGFELPRICVWKETILPLVTIPVRWNSQGNYDIYRWISKKGELLWQSWWEVRIIFSSILKISLTFTSCTIYWWNRIFTHKFFPFFPRKLYSIMNAICPYLSTLSIISNYWRQWGKFFKILIWEMNNRTFRNDTFIDFSQGYAGRWAFEDWNAEYHENDSDNNHEN